MESCNWVPARYSERPLFRRNAIPKGRYSRVRVRVRVRNGGPSEWRTFGVADRNHVTDRSLRYALPYLSLKSTPRQPHVDRVPCSLYISGSPLSTSVTSSSVDSALSRLVMSSSLFHSAASNLHLFTYTSHTLSSSP